MRKKTDTIFIQEPPLQELNKKRSCLKRTCATGCGCIIIFLVGSLILLQLLGAPREKQLKELPAHLATAVPLYDKDNIDHITFISQKDNGHFLETTLFVPRLVLSPIVLLFADTSVSGTPQAPTKKKTIRQKLLSFVREPVADMRDIYIIEWTNLSAEPSFIITFYKNELQKRGFSTDPIMRGKNEVGLLFQQGTITAEMEIADTPQQPGTDHILMVLYFTKNR